MELNIKQTGDITLIEITKNETLVNPQNPVTPDELEDLDFPPASGKGLIISGMPVYAVVAVATAYKNTFGWVATLDPRLGGAVVCHTIDPLIKAGQVIPLP